MTPPKVKTVCVCTNKAVEKISELKEEVESLEFEIEKADDLILDCWNQFSYDRPDGSRSAGGVSSLESVEEYLEVRGLLKR